MRFNAGRHNLSPRALFVVAAVCGVTSAYADTITVTNTAGSGPGSLRQAIVDAQESDTIVFAENVRGTIALTGTGGELVISKALTILGPGANLLSIDAGNASRVLSVDEPGRVVSISGLEFTHGSEGIGGGILNYADLTLTACTVSACHAFSLGAYGGGIFNEQVNVGEPPVLHMVGCTLTGNSSLGGAGFHGSAGGDASGGALSNAGGRIWLQNCTITGNTATGGPGGCLPLFGCGPQGEGYGGIYNNGELLVESCTIAFNSGNSVGGIVVFGSARMANTIVAQNTGNDAEGSFISDGYNLIGQSDGSSGFTAIGDQTGTSVTPIDPMLGVLRDNGGPTATMALLPGSPAIDKGNAATVATDQRGFRRRDDFPNIANANGGDASDIGAFEVRHAGLLNISTRARVLPGDNALIAGFIITHGQPKEVIVRGIGPSLSLPGKLEDPTIEVHDDHGIAIAYNDNWPDATTVADIERTLPPASPLESALWGIINPAAYSVVLRGKNDTSGIGVVEVYDLDSAADSGLGNISTRGFAGTNDEVMICGIIVGPTAFSTNTRVVLRALGPTLAQFGISNALADPVMDVRDGNGAQVGFNDDWQNDPFAQTVAALGLAPGDPHESATLLTVSGGAYTAIVRGATDDAIGVALVEAYEVGPE